MDSVLYLVSWIRLEEKNKKTKLSKLTHLKHTHVHTNYWSAPDGRPETETAEQSGDREPDRTGDRDKNRN